jgi:pseudouridine-5'-phosphate glycosidase
MSQLTFTTSPEVTEALKSGKPIVALESTIISHGLPRPSNLTVAREVEEIVRSRGAVPATIAVLDGVVHIGLTDDQLVDIANRDDIAKASSRDLAIIAASGKSAATTVAATAHLAVLAGIHVFATGGLGGVHRGANETFDESADLTALSQLDITTSAPA